MTNLLFDRLFARSADTAPALITGALTFTYGGLERETARFANALVAAGVKPDDRVAVQVEKSASNLVLYLATVRAGAVFLPLNPAYTIAELAYFLGDAAPRLIVCDPAIQGRVRDIAGASRVETLDSSGEGTLSALAADRPESFATVARGPDDLAAICYTSGTTGRSKGAMLTHRALTSNAGTLVDLWRFTSMDVLIHALPIYHVHGLFVATHVSMMAGAAMLFLPKFEADAVVASMPRATCLMGIPTFYTRLLARADLTRKAVAEMRLFVSGSAPLLTHTHTQWTARTGTTILERYGMTETGMNTSNPYDGERVAGSVGFPLPGVALRIVDEMTGLGLAAGEIGMIEVKGPNVCAGYWRDAVKSTEAFREDGFFITGDLGVVDGKGYLSIVGRGNDLIISGGLNVYPKEVETQIDALDGVSESAVIGLPHPDLGEAVTAIIATGEAPGLTESGILAALADRLAAFKRPKRILFTGELPRNAMGKVQKASLREQYSSLYG